MANIFNKTNQLYENPNRNTFQHDHSFHGTFNFGDLYPVMCKEVIPGTSVSINPTIALKMMPMLFPIQSRIKAYLHFFYIPYRTLWKDWKDFIGDTKKGLNKPFINPETTEIKTGSLADYLGLPTTISGSQTYPLDYRAVNLNIQETLKSLVYDIFPSSDDGSQHRMTYVSTAHLNDALDLYLNETSGLTSTFEEYIENYTSYSADTKYNLVIGVQQLISAYNQTYDIKSFKTSNEYPKQISSYIRGDYSKRLVCISALTSGNIFTDKNTNVPFGVLECPFSAYENYVKDNFVIVQAKINDEKDYHLYIMPSSLFSQSAGNYTSLSILSNPNHTFFDNAYRFDFSTRLEKVSEIYDSISSIDVSLVSAFLLVESDENVDNFMITSIPDYKYTQPRNTVAQGGVYTYEDRGVVDISTLSSDENPYFVSSDLKIDAGPFRAYESIYNVYYRDDRNNPRIVNGEPVYNEFIPNDAGGLDNYAYKLHKRNWEQDFLTLAVQSPQQGVAPLVGITSRGEFQFKDEENGRLYTAQANYSSDGDTIESFTINSADMPKSSLKQLMTYATEGISISDLRNVNALQRWLEINMRRGYRYKDQIMSHFGVDVRYDELMMPEFIGGMSADVFVNQINNTAQSVGNPLGSFAGQGSSINKSQNTIHHYCQEHGYIIGILSISPTANYSQLLPKHFTKREILDYFFPEFGHIGFQPIPYKEVAPLSAFLAGKSLDDTFGYQRAWYDYLASNDSVHGLFRTNLKNFVVQRIFNSYPELTPEFLTIDHNDLDDIFAVESSNVSHKFFGEIFFDMKMKLPIPEYGTPKLEV